MTPDEETVQRDVQQVGLVATARTHALCMTQNYTAELIRHLVDALAAADADADRLADELSEWGYGRDVSEALRLHDEAVARRSQP